MLSYICCKCISGLLWYLFKAIKTIHGFPEPQLWIETGTVCAVENYCIDDDTKLHGFWSLRNKMNQLQLSLYQTKKSVKSHAENVLDTSLKPYITISVVT